MTHFRLIPLAAALVAASTLIACNTAPSMPMGSASAQGMGAPGQMNPMGQMGQMGKMDMSKMDAQMKKMRDMHEKMAAAKTPEDRNKLMAEHMKTMQDGMQMMGGMSSPGMGGSGSGMGDMKGMPGMGANSGTPGDMAARQQMMEKHMEMMQSMMQMMMDRMPPAPVR